MSKIFGFEDCEKELRRLLEEAKRSVEEAHQEGDDAVKEAVRTATNMLVDFTNRTEPNDILDDNEFRAIQQLDSLADEARREITWAAMGEIIAKIQERESELNQLTKEITRQTVELERQAKRNRLENVREAIDSITDVVETFKEFKNNLQDNSDENKVSTKINGFVQSFEKLKKSVDTIFNQIA